MLQLRTTRYRVFHPSETYGNQTVVYDLNAWPSDQALRQLAQRAQCHETTFVCWQRGQLEVRWFAGEAEVPLCGHGALAAAAFLQERMGEDSWVDVANKPGCLWLGRYRGQASIAFARQPLKAAPAGVDLAGAPADCMVYDAGRDWLFHTANPQAFAAFTPQASALLRLDKLGIILVAPSARSDAQFRFFAPAVGILEDPASASAIPALASLIDMQPGRSYLFTQGAAEQISIHAQALADRLCVWGYVEPIDIPGARYEH